MCTAICTIITTGNSAAINRKSFEKYLHDTYHSIGANSPCFNPLKNVPASDIVPTEYDSLFRQSLIHGRVHDEGLPLWERYIGSCHCLAPQTTWQS